MSSEQISIIAGHPFVQRFVLAILQNNRTKNLVHDEKYVIHADLVPRVSEKVMARSFASRDDRKQKTENNIPVVPLRVPVRRVIPQRVMMPKPQIVLPFVNSIELSQDYGKITPLLNDASVSTIECQGDGKPIMIIRAGQRQLTRIVLSAKEIKDVLEKVSDAVHIPILEGVFRATVDNFSVNAIVSEIIGSRFVIKKQNAYSMLEERGN